jgi:hypothetical protein
VLSGGRIGGRRGSRRRGLGGVWSVGCFLRRRG